MSQDQTSKNNVINEGDHWQTSNIDFFADKPLTNKILNYLRKIMFKLIETLMSVKVWIIFGVIGITTWMAVNGYISGDNLATIWVGVVCPIAISREAFKITRIFSDAKEKLQNMIQKNNDTSEK